MEERDVELYKIDTTLLEFLINFMTTSWTIGPQESSGFYPHVSFLQKYVRSTILTM